MERTTRARIFDAAVELFYFHGFPAASMRDLGEMAGVNAATIYHHYPSKRHLLVAVIEQHLGELERLGAQAVIGHADPAAKLRSLVAVHVDFHCWHAKETTIGDRELYSLPVNLRRRAVRLRDGYEALWTAVLEEGVAAGVFTINDPGVCRLALISLCSQVAAWFRPDGRLAVEDIVREYETFSLRLVGTTA